ncbi:hypothetical protein AAH979_42235 [Plantactinospora sp. ZYX-F-223]|uniref:hypothetical protein n=1 Tax=Plantactinospora sp. ZYX-F-223 TaxID=3144103 RepID=UPI0031FC28AE
MGKFLLSVHVLAAIVFIGPVTVAVSLFPRYARTALTGRGTGDLAVTRSAAVAALLHRISRVYALLGLSVPVAGLAVAVELDVLADGWLVVSIVLTAAAAALLGLVVLPAQRGAMVALDADGPDAESARARSLAGSSRLAAAAGVFALLWAVVVVLMVFRPGSTTGV